MNVVGLLEADFQRGREYEAGGVGPLFREKRIEEPYSVWQIISHCAVALGSLDIIDLVSLFIDEEEIPLEEDDEEDTSDDVMPEDLGEVARGAYGEGDPTGFLIMFTFDDDKLSYVISIEGASDHAYDEASISVLVRATPVGEDADEYDADGAFQDAVEQLLDKLQAALDKELAIERPEIDLWYEDAAQERLPGETSSIGLP